jgi:hypothetical protein
MDEGPNPPLKIGAPQAPSSLEELKAFHAENGTLASFLIDIGFYYGRSAPGDPQRRRSEERER